MLPDMRRNDRSTSREACALSRHDPLPASGPEYRLPESLPLRGCYCRTDGYRCLPDCKADLIEPWMRIYDGLHGRKRRDPRKLHFLHLDSAMAKLERGFRETG